MWKLLPWAGRSASGYPQRQCFFCCTTSIILPPYQPSSSSAFENGAVGGRSGTTEQPQPNLATSSTTSISTGTPTNWFCSSCHCQNVANKDGSPLEQYTRPMWDEDWNRDRSQMMRHTRPHPSSAAKASSRSPLSPTSVFPGKASAAFAFCHTCQTNQVLTLNMLADYLPSEDDPEYQDKLEHLPEYEASLATRYPPVCSDCAPRVQQRITERDQYARSWSLGKWLDLKKKASFADLADPGSQGRDVATGPPLQAAPDAQIRQTHPVEARSARNRDLSNVWSLDPGSTVTMIISVVVNLGMWSFYLATFLHPLEIASIVQRAARRVEADPISLYTARVVPLTLLCLPWLLTRSARVEPLKRAIEKARARQVRVEAKGVHLWRTAQLVIVALRLCLLLLIVWASFDTKLLTRVLLWLAAATESDFGDLLRLAAMAVLVCEVGLTAFAASQLRVELPSPLQLVSRPIVANGCGAKSTDVCGDPLLTSLSLDDRASRATFGLSRTVGLDQAMPDTPMDESDMIPPAQRDADGDAVMEDAATYTARRMSQSSDEDWDLNLGSRLPPPSAASRSHHWPKVALPQPGVASASHTGPGTGAGAPRSTAYPDFQLGPQRFWEPQNPTGLEDVFGRAVSLDDGPSNDADGNVGDASRKWSQWFGFS